MKSDAAALLERLEADGYVLEALPGELRIAPTPTSAELTQQLTVHQADLHHILTSRAKCGGKDRLELLRRFAPKLWQMVELTDGRKGLMWGISPYGIMVSLGPKKPILTLNPEDIKP